TGCCSPAISTWYSMLFTGIVSKDGPFYHLKNRIMQAALKIYNGRVITPYRTLPRGTVVVDGGRIVAVSEQDIPVENALEIDAGGNYVSPGFIDIHVHGGG